MEIKRSVDVSLFFNPEPHIPFFFSIYDLKKILVIRKNRSRIRSKLILRTITRSLFSWTGKKRAKFGRVVSRKTRKPKIKSMTTETIISFLYLMARADQPRTQLYLILSEKQHLSDGLIALLFYMRQTDHSCRRCTMRYRKYDLCFLPQEAPYWPVLNRD